MKRSKPCSPCQCQSRSIQVSTEFYEKLSEIATSRGVGLEDLLRIAIAGTVKIIRTLGLDDILEFGKYRGELVENVIRIDPRYMNWVVGNTCYGLDEEAQDLLDEISSDGDGSNY